MQWPQEATSPISLDVCTLDRKTIEIFLPTQTPSKQHSSRKIRETCGRSPRYPKFSGLSDSESGRRPHTHTHTQNPPESATTHFFLPRPDPGPNSGLLGAAPPSSPGVACAGLPGVLAWFSSAAARGQPDTEWCAVYLPVMWPDPSQPAVGHLTPLRERQLVLLQERLLQTQSGNQTR